MQQFIRAWVVSRGYANPEEALLWIEKMMPVESDLFLAMNALPERMEAMRKGDVVRLGESPGFEAFPVEESFDEGIRTASQCEAAAQEMGAPDMAAESRCVASALRVLRGIYRLSRAAAGTDRDRVTEALGNVNAEIEAALAAAKAQTGVWTTMSLSTAQQFDQHTANYWKSLEGTLASSVSPVG